jgi:hypothetical protein
MPFMPRTYWSRHHLPSTRTVRLQEYLWAMAFWIAILLFCFNSLLFLYEHPRLALAFGLDASLLFFLPCL